VLNAFVALFVYVLQLLGHLIVLVASQAAQVQDERK